MKQTLKRGFTLIELLVVIAIIGILAAVVLTSLTTARDKGSNASAISSVNSGRAQAELYYSDNSNSYDGVCAANGSNNGLADLLTGAGSAVNGTADCGDTDNGWAAEIALLDADGFYCVDSTGVAVTASTTHGITDASGSEDVTCD